MNQLLLNSEVITSEFLLRLWKLKYPGKKSEIDTIISLACSTKIDANPHQIEASAFAINSLCERSVLLADEVGLGKTIEAGLVIKNITMSEERTKIIIAAPNALLEQWQSELETLFQIDSKIFTKPSEFRTFDTGVAICTDHVILNSKLDEDKDVSLVVIDEAHRFRNWYVKEKSSLSKICGKLAPHKKILLTATPIQISINDFYSLICLMENQGPEYIQKLNTRFGGNDDVKTKELADFSSKYVYRNLRKDVLNINYPPRKIHYSYVDSISDEEIFAIESIERFLTGVKAETKAGALIASSFLKLYASSPLLFFSALLNNISGHGEGRSDLAIKKIEGYLISQGLQKNNEDKSKVAEEPIASFDSCISILNLATTFVSSKLVHAANLLTEIINKPEICANRKIVVFTQYVTTQYAIRQRLIDIGVSEDKIGIFNGTTKNRKQIIEEFRKSQEYLIITDAGCFGLNLQFCNCLVNFDLPWNPMTVEQRVGRIHRYGQKHTANVFNLVMPNFEFEKKMIKTIFDRCELSREQFGASNEILTELQYTGSSDFWGEVENEQLTSEEILQLFEEKIDKYKKELDEADKKMRARVDSILHQDTKNLLKLDEETLKAEVTKTINFVKKCINISSIRHPIWEGVKLKFAGPTPISLPHSESDEYQLWNPFENNPSLYSITLDHPYIKETFKVAQSIASFNSNSDVVRVFKSEIKGSIFILNYLNEAISIQSNIKIVFPRDSDHYDMSKAEGISLWREFTETHKDEIAKVKEDLMDSYRTLGFTNSYFDKQKLRLLSVLGGGV